MNFGASARRISEMAGRFVEVHWPIFFVLVLLFFVCSLFLFKPLLPHNFPDVPHALSC